MYSVLVQYLFLLSAYPLARWVLPRISNRQHAIIFHFTIGLGFCSFFFRQRIILAIGMSLIGYYILDSNPWIVLAVSFFMNTFVHFVQFMWPISLKVSNLTMIIFYKIAATSFNLEDGKALKSKSKDLDKRKKAFHLVKKPSLFEFLAYCFTPFGSISPSFYEYKLFDYLLDLGQNPKRVSEQSRSKAIDCLKRSAINGLIYYVFRHFFTMSFYKSEAFLSLNIIFRIILVCFVGVIIFSKDFMFWKVVDAGLFEAGFEDSGFATEADFTSLTFQNLLTKKTIKEWSHSFNYTNEIFWSNYLKSRGEETGLGATTVNYITYFAKPIFKGLYGGILMASFEKSLFLEAEKVLQAFVPRFTKSPLPNYVFAQILMVLNRASMRFKTTYSFFYVNYVIYFISWIVTGLMVVAGKFLLKPENAAKKEEKEEDVKHVKED